MKKLIFVLSLIGIISTGYGQKISTLVEDGDTIETLTNNSYISLSELDGTPATVAIRLLPMFTDIDADVAALDTRVDTDSARIEITEGMLQDSLGWSFVDPTYGDGLSSATLHIQSKIDERYNAGGGVVYINDGTYGLDSSIYMKSNVTLRGSGHTVLKALSTWSNDNRFEGLIAFAADQQNMIIEHLKIDGNNSETIEPKKQLFGISSFREAPYYYTDPQNVIIRNCEIYNTSEFAINFLSTQFQNPSPTRNITIQDNYIHSCGDTLHAGGIRIDAAADIKIIGNRIDSSYEHGLYLSKGYNYLISDNIIQGNGLGDRQAGTGMSVRIDSNAVITDNLVTNNFSQGISVTRNYSTWAAGFRARNILIDGNTVVDNNEDVTVVRSQIGVLGAEDVMISNNIVRKYHNVSNSYSNGIQVRGNSMNVTVQGNHITESRGIILGDLATDTMYNFFVLNNTMVCLNKEGEIIKGDQGLRLIRSADISNNVIVKDNIIDDYTYGIYIYSEWLATETRIEGNIISDSCTTKYYDLSTTDKKVILTNPRNSGDIVAATGITGPMLTGVLYYNGSSAIDITASPQIVDGYDGQVLEIIGLSETNTLTLNHGNGIDSGGETAAIALGDYVRLRYIEVMDIWHMEVFRDN